MPKWLIILLVVFLIVILGCCGGVGTCIYLGKKAVQAAKDNAGTIEQQIQDRAQQAERDAAARAANGGGGIPTGGGVTGGGAGGSTGGSGGGSGTSGGGGGVLPSMGSLPTNFPKDVPVMAGMAPAGVAVADNANGSGVATFTTSQKRQDVAAYYTTAMKDQGWSVDQNMDIGQGTMMVFSKDTRKAVVQAVTTDNQTMVTVQYQSK
jgi:hypothetical protein